MHQLTLPLHTPTQHFTPIVAATNAMHSMYSGSNSPTAALIAAIYNEIPCCILPGNPVLAAYAAALAATAEGNVAHHHNHTSTITRK